MEKNKEESMTDLEIIKKNFNIITDSESAGYDYWYELEKEALDAATRMAAEIERLQDEIKVLRFCIKTNGELAQEMNEENTNQRYEMENLRTENELYYEENLRLKAALAEKPDIVRCGECSNLVINDNAKYCGICLDAKRKRNDFCSRGTRKEAKDED